MNNHDFNFHIQTILNNIKNSIKYGKKEISEAISEYKNDIKEICGKYKKPLKLEYDQISNTLYAITNDNEYTVSLQ